MYEMARVDRFRDSEETADELLPMTKGPRENKAKMLRSRGITAEGSGLDWRKLILEATDLNCSPYTYTP